MKISILVTSVHKLQDLQLYVKRCDLYAEKYGNCIWLLPQSLLGNINVIAATLKELQIIP